MLNFIKNTFKGKKNYNFLEDLYFDSSNYNNKSGVQSYKHNVIVNRCVNIIAHSAGHVPWIVFKHNATGLTKVSDHRVNRLLKKPNLLKGGAEFFSEIIANKLLFGNAYVLAVSGRNDLPPSELHSLNPSCVEIMSSLDGISAYKYVASSSDKMQERIYPVNKINRHSRILHIKNYNPCDSFSGLSCLDPANNLIDLHNRATQWNHTLLKNGARPSGALVVGNGNYLSDEQFQRLRQELQEKYYGSNNAGKPMLLEGGLDWKEMSISPRDMDFIESKNSAAREIALAFGVPPQLLGINGDNTYSNMQEARLALWEETLIPLLDKIADSLSNWLSDWFCEQITIDFDRDAISILTEKRQQLWSTLTQVDFMSVNEKRAMVGLCKVAGGDQICSKNE
jgi:HK97 family phage portal protein